MPNSRKLSYSKGRYNSSTEIFKKAHVSDSVCFHDGTNFLEATITQVRSVILPRHSTPSVYRCFIPIKQKIEKKLLGYIIRKA